MPTNDPTPNDRVLRVVAPFDGGVLAELETANAEEAEHALDTAHRLFRNRRGWLPIAERIGILERTTRIMLRERVALAKTLAQEAGKPLIDSELEVEQAIDTVKLCALHLRTSTGSVLPVDGTDRTARCITFGRREPIGVAVAMCAFNHSWNTIVHQIAAAVAAGCPLIVIPSSHTPLGCQYLGRILREAGLPDSWCQILLTGDPELADGLTRDSRVGMLSFLGRPEIGWMLRSRLSPGTRCTLNHGGENPVLILDDADCDFAAKDIIRAAFYHAGQAAVSMQRIFAPCTRARELAETLTERVRKLHVGDPGSSQTDVGPLIGATEAQRVHAWVAETIAAGAECLSGGERIGHSLFQPTVLFDPPSDSLVSRLTAAGPVISIYSYDDVDEAVARVNAVPHFFQAAVFTKSIDCAMRVFRNLDAAAVIVNDGLIPQIAGISTSGFRESGLRVGDITHAIDHMQVEKSLILHSAQL